MAKATTVQARVETVLKKQADTIFKQIGITPSQAINAFYAQTVLHSGIPFELKIPNAETRAAMEELEAGKGHRYKNFKEVLKELDEDDT